MDVKIKLNMLKLIDEETGEKYKVATVRPISEVAQSARDEEWEFIKMKLEETAETVCSENYK